ncbi:hypothetical protein SOVF_142710, partial [Spinacia oleracea]
KNPNILSPLFPKINNPNSLEQSSSPP